MSKADTLLKKATFFERMALYSDRKVFLQSLAQEVTTAFTKEFGPDVRQQLEGVLMDMQAVGIPSSISGPIQLEMSNLENYNKGAIIAALKQAASRYPADRATQLQNLQSLIAKLEGAPAQQQPQDTAGGAGETMTFAPERITGFRPIDKDKQDALGRIVTIEGLAFVDPKKMNDGKLGPETRKALTAFKNWVRQPKMSDDDALNMAQMMSQAPKYSG